MGNIIDLMARANALRHEEAANSITPERVGGIMFDTLDLINEERIVPQGNGEDINSNAQGKLQFANRPNTDGMGYVILRPDKPFAEQVTQDNTIYEVRYVFDLEGDITIPNDCILRFNGGEIRGGHTVTGQKTNIESGLCQIFGIDVTIAGSWNITEAFPEWFGAEGDGVSNDTTAVQKTISSWGRVCLSKRYLVGTLSVSADRTSIRGVDRRSALVYASNSGDLFTLSSNIREVTMRDFVMTGTYSQNTVALHFNESNGGAEHYFDNIRIDGFGYGIKAGSILWNCFFMNMRFEGNNYGLFIQGQGSCIVNSFIHCYFGVSYSKNVYMDNTVNTSFINCNFGNNPNSDATGKFLEIRLSRQTLFQNCNFESSFGNSIIFLYSTMYTIFDCCKFHDFTISNYYAYIADYYCEFRNCTAAPRNNTWGGNFILSQDLNAKIALINCSGIKDHVAMGVGSDSYMGHLYVNLTDNSICGPSNQRPLKSIAVGHIFFDTTLGKPIWLKGYDGSDNPIWVDATGATVS